MTKDQKNEFVEAIDGYLEQASAVYLTDYSGLTVEKANQLRTQFRDAGVDYRVLKNTLIRLAMERRGGYDELIEYLNGPTAVAFTADPSAPARVIRDFLKKTDGEKPAFKAAFVEGSVYHSDQLEVLSNLKTKDELLADILGLLLSPMANVVGALQAQGSNIAAILQTLAEREQS